MTSLPSGSRSVGKGGVLLREPRRRSSASAAPSPPNTALWIGAQPVVVAKAVTKAQWQ